MSTAVEFRKPELITHDELLLVTAGHGSHEIDFVTYPCRPGTLLRAHAGQVVRRGGQAGLDAVLVRWTPDLIDETATLGRAHWQLVGEDEDAIINEISQLVVDSQRPRRTPLVTSLLEHQLRVLLLRIALLPGDPGDGVPASAGVGQPAAPAAGEPEEGPGLPSRLDTFRRFQQEVERDHARTRRVEEYAERLGCAVRTVTRASLGVTGRTAKQVIDDRVALQAKRLLAATDLPVAEVGQRLGFPEPTNFGRFFQREVGRSPGAFRAGVRQSGRRDAAPPARPIGLPGGGPGLGPTRSGHR
ncbi:AraC family transcriptional regulator [Solwaraspora sp. WMMD406]|uniref:helix-turn-helix domain-containing protein n=1 Tax=Solwaraspora sp. WMMD406 TaxID=3016095 RepID=UPI0024162785|nr:AraC family transcriptional regulator [Solwaraspora sp. WMMD406]MDG4766802.1 AraC family transcriptional regulator [Solwaraspora sp. WMMD406]